MPSFLAIIKNATWQIGSHIKQSLANLIFIMFPFYGNETHITNRHRQWDPKWCAGRINYVEDEKNIDSFFPINFSYPKKGLSPRKPHQNIKKFLPVFKTLLDKFPHQSVLMCQCGSRKSSVIQPIKVRSYSHRGFSLYTCKKDSKYLKSYFNSCEFIHLLCVYVCVCVYGHVFMHPDLSW